MKIIIVHVFLFLSLEVMIIQGCTTFVIGKKATKDGSVLATHTNDGGGTTDPRLVRIPAQDFADNALRPVWNSPENYPRYVGYDRGAIEYYPENCQSGSQSCVSFKPIGYIPQVKHTYAYYESTYGIMNENQVGIAESTCSGVFSTTSISAGGKALLSVDQLSQIAMERATTAREACQLMGDLAEKYGFYGESDSFEGGSESLMVTDPNEGWVFHVMADPTGTSAIWVAARVPDDSVAVVANMFSVRDVNLTDTFNFLGRQDMWELAAQQKLWTPDQPKDFTATFSDGEYSHKYYSGRRMWGVFRLLSPSAQLSPTYGNLKADKPYPFAVKVDKPVTPQDCMAVLRDWYNDSEYSTSVGVAGGPFGSPDRYSTSTADHAVTGNWERTIALYRTSDSIVVQSRSWLPNEIGGVIWFGPHSATATAYVPIVMGMTRVPDCLSSGWQGVFNLNQSFWVHRVVENLAQIKFSYMIQDIRDLQSSLETASQTLLDNMAATVDQSSVALRGSRSTVDYDSVFSANAQKARDAFAQLANDLLFKYADGYINRWVGNKFTSTSAGYPVDWLDQDSVGYTSGPPPPLSEAKFQQ